MAELFGLRHQGRHKETGRRLVVLFKQLPGDPDKALVCNHECLPDKTQELVLKVLNSKESKADENFGDTLGKVYYHEYKTTLIDYLHRNNYLYALNIDKIDMLPRPGIAIPLRKVIEALDAVNGTNNQPSPKMEEIKLIDDVPINELVEDTATLGFNTEEIAKGMLTEVEVLREKANKLEQEAYELCPELNKKVPEHKEEPTSSYSNDPSTAILAPEERLVFSNKNILRLDMDIPTENDNNTL